MSESDEADIVPSPSSIVRVPTDISRVPTDITRANSTLARPVIPSESAIKNVTYWKLDLDTILDGLIPNPLPESSGKDNAIHHLNIIVFGKPNTGKTTLAESIAEALARRYGMRNVKALRSTRDLPALFQSIPKLFGRFRRPPKAIVLFADDMTKAIRKLSGTVEVKNSKGQPEKMRRVDYWLDKWYDIRGELFRHGMRQGLVVMVASLHRFYGGDVDLRADADLLLVRSTGTPGTFDAQKVERMLGPVVYYAMRQHEVDALRDRKELAWTAFVAKTGSGVFRVPRPSVSAKWIMRNIGSPETHEADTELAEPEPVKKTIVKEEPAVRSVQKSLPRPAAQNKTVTRARTTAQGNKWGRRVSRTFIVIGVLTILYLAWIYVWPLVK